MREVLKEIHEKHLQTPAASALVAAAKERRYCPIDTRRFFRWVRLCYAAYVADVLGIEWETKSGESRAVSSAILEDVMAFIKRKYPKAIPVCSLLS